MDPVLRYHAGRRALARLRDRGLRPEDVRAVVGTASGPRWLALVGLDRALIDAGLAAATEGAPPRLLVGASAGAWRMAAFAARDPAACHRRLVEGYVGQAFPRGVRPEAVTEAYRLMLAEVFGDEDVRHALGRRSTDLAVHAARLRGPWPWARRAVQATALGAVALARRVRVDLLPAVAARVLFHARPERLGPRFEGALATLSAANAHAALLASGTVPLHLRPVRAIAGAPRGAYVDGGLTDYHLRQRWVAPGEGLVLLPHVEARVVADGMARYGRGRSGPDPDVLDDVLLIRPSRGFVASLPEGRVPDRDDFFRDVDRPAVRMRRWREAVERSAALGEALASDLLRGRIPDRVVPLPR